MKRLTLVAATALAVLAMPAAADANLVDLTGGSLRFIGGPEQNNVYVVFSGGTYTVGDSTGTPILAGAGCSNPENDSTVACSGSVIRYEISLEGGNDTFQGDPGPSLPTPSGTSQLNGGDGDDQIRGTRGHDNLHGDDGNDTLSGGPGDDWFFGGGGAHDVADYENAGGAVTVDLAPGVDNDGATGTPEADDANHDNQVEDVVGSNADDTIKGSGGPNTIFGAGGNDHIEGLGGDDELSGGTGTDSIDGGADRDTVSGTGSSATGAEPDTLIGGPGHDRVSYEGRRDAVRIDLADPGPDGAAGELDSVSGFESASGGDGNDVLVGTDAFNNLYGDDGDDLLDGGLDGDEIAGGAGEDTITYASRTAGVTVDLAPGAAGSGYPGESDFFDSVENVVGGSGTDSVSGNDRRNLLDGGPGGDFIAARGGADDVQGGDGGDFIATGDGDDVIRAGAGKDIVEAGPGDDLLQLRDGEADSGECNIGFDTIVADAADVIANCEGVDTGAGPPVPAPPAGTSTRDAVRPKVTLGKVSTRALKRKSFLKGLPLTLSCDEACSFDVELRGSARSVRLARYEVTLGTRALPVGTGARKVTLKPSKKLVGRARKLTVQLRVVATDAAGNRTTLTRTLKVR